MIEIFNEVKGSLETFKNYDDLFKYIKAIERQKLIEQGQEGWIFTIYSNESLERFYWNAIKAIEILLTEKEQDAYENGLDLLEMSKGYEDSTTQIILTPDIDIEVLKEDWCKDYCLSHGYIFLGTRQ